jgi:pSer/pThr/pTyr-binding forkhead associated (FHA) protein/tetratricopeptide (TPR) repeat protein
MKINLLLKKDEQIVRKTEISHFPCRIGRSKDNDLILEEPHISRHHAMIELIGNEIVITNISQKGKVLFEGENIEGKQTLELPGAFEIPPFEITIVSEPTAIKKFESKLTEPLFEEPPPSLAESFPLTIEAEETKISEIPPRAKIIVIQGTSPHEGYDLIGDEIIIGRDPDCDISLEDPKISREHAKITLKDQKFYIADCGSSNGTFVNHKQIVEEKELTSSDQIQLGDAVLQFAIFDEGAYLLPHRPERLSPDITESGMIPQWETPQWASKVPFYAPKPQKIFFRYKKIFYASGLLLSALLIYLMINQKGKPQRETAEEKKRTKITRTIEDELSQLSKTDREYILEKMKAAKASINNREYRKAQIALEEVFAIAPGYSEARALSETLRSVFEQQRLAEQKYREIAEEKRQEEEIKYHLSVALEYFNRQQWSKAIEEYDKILETVPEHEEAQKKRLEAIKELEAPEVKPAVSLMQKRNRQAEAWLAQGTTLAQQGETQKALAIWRKVLGLEGVNPAYYIKAEQFINFEKERLAQKYAPLLSQAYALIESKEYTQAEEILRGILKEYPTHKEAKEALYKVQDTLHQLARREYTEAIIDENVGRIDSAVKKFKWIIERVPESDEYHKKAKNKLKKYE